MCTYACLPAPFCPGRSLERVALPVNESVLAGEAQRAERAALERFERQRFGTAVDALRQALGAAIEKELM